MELPLWVVAAEMAGLLEADSSRASPPASPSARSRRRSAATLDDAELTESAGMKPEREAELLAEWA